MGSLVAPIFGIYVFDKGEFLTVSLALLPTPATTLLLSALDAFGANLSDNPIVFNIKLSGAATLLKPYIKR